MKRKQFNSKFKIDNSQKGKNKRTFNGILFDSETELRYFRDYLLPLKEKGEIKNIVLQPKYILQSKFKKYGKVILPIYYVSDFEVEYQNGKVIIVDVKGLPTPEAKMKRKMFDYKYPDKELQWIGLSIQDGGWIQFDELAKARSKRKKEKKQA